MIVKTGMHSNELIDWNTGRGELLKFSLFFDFWSYY